MYFDCFLRIPNVWLGQPELLIYTDSDWIKVKGGATDIVPFAVNPNYFPLFTDGIDTLVKIRMENSNLAHWVDLVPDGVDPFSMVAVKALDVEKIYLGVSLVDEVFVRWPDTAIKVPVYDDLGLIVGAKHLVEDTLIA